VAGEGCGQRVEVERAVGLQGHVDQGATTDAHDLQERRVDRCRNDDRRAGRGEPIDDVLQSAHDIGDEVDQGRIGRPTPTLVGASREDRRQRRRMVVGRVAKITVGDRCAQRVGDRRGDVEVHVGDPGGEHVGRVTAPLRAAPAPQRALVDRFEERATVDGHEWITIGAVPIGTVFIGTVFIGTVLIGTVFIGAHLARFGP